jgi:hypothetical protein
LKSASKIFRQLSRQALGKSAENLSKFGPEVIFRKPEGPIRVDFRTTYAGFPGIEGRMGRQAAVVLYVLALIAVVVGVDLYSSRTASGSG